MGGDHRGRGQRAPLPPIDFAGLAAALLDRADTLVPQWLPEGHRRGAEWVCGDIHGGSGSSCSINLKTGAWGDFSGDERGGDLISLYAAIHSLNNGQAAARLMQMLGWRREPVQATARVSPPTAPAAPAQANAGGEAPAEAPAPATRRTTKRPIVPVPEFAPACTGVDWHYGQPDALWLYRRDGAVLGAVARYRDSEGGKEIKPWTWCVDDGDPRQVQGWHSMQWPEPRPLYLPRGTVGDTLPVVLVEGEKCADAGHGLLGDEFDFVSWPGGSNAWQKADWSWLAGRRVTLWPDADSKRVRLSRQERESGVDPDTKPLLPAADQPGMKCMLGIGRLLADKHGCSVTICSIPKPGDVSDGWDVADAIAQGWTADQVRAFVGTAGTLSSPAADSRSTPSRAPAGEGQEDDVPHWRDLLAAGRQGTFPTRENVVLALMGRPERGVKGLPETEGLIQFNQFSNTVVKTRRPPWGGTAGNWCEDDELQMGAWLVAQHGMPSISRAQLEEAVLVVAHRHAVHPLRERVTALRDQWDGVGRLNTWLQRVCLEEDEWDNTEPLQQYLARVGAWFVMGMVARVMPEVRQGARVLVGPGAKFDAMLIFESPQGWGKSTLAATLGGEFFADTGLTIGDKDSLQNIQGIWVYEWGELHSLTKAEANKVKEFVTSAKDRFRATFDRRPRDYPRQVVFVGTTNEQVYLSDPTGNRRFWPVRLTRRPDLDYLRANLEQLLAEAVHRVDAGERFWPTPKEQDSLFEPQQQQRVVQSSLDAAIRTYLYDEDQRTGLSGVNGTLVKEIGLSDLLCRVGYTIDKQSPALVKSASQVMHALGWPLRRTSKPGRPYVYVRPPSAEAGAAGASLDSSSAAAGASHQPDEALDGCPF
jgi:putative DNA primase/helicase